MNIYFFASASDFESVSPIQSRSSPIPKNIVPPIPFANALTVFSQLFGFFISNALLNSDSAASEKAISNEPFRMSTEFLKFISC